MNQGRAKTLAAALGVSVLVSALMPTSASAEVSPPAVCQQGPATTVGAGFSGAYIDTGAAASCPGNTGPAPGADKIQPVAKTHQPGPQPYFAKACVQSDSNVPDPICIQVQETLCNKKPDGQLMVLMVPVPGSKPTEWARSGARVCQYPGDPSADEKEPVFTLAEFRRLPLKPARIVTQPGRHTLKGAYTNIYADIADQSFSPRLAGKVFSVRAHPSSFAWKYGDGTAKTFTIQGGPLRPDQAELDSETRTSHVYAETGDYNISVTTTYTGEYSVDGGPWIPIIGTAQVNSPAVPMSVWRTETHLYAENCIENPQGAGCPGPDR